MEADGKYPAIFGDPVKGSEGQEVFDDAAIILKRL
jgi:hypothetical protein